MRPLVPVAALTLAWSLACATSGENVEDTGTVASSTTADGDCDSNISGTRDPEPALVPLPYHLSGSAWKDDAGVLRVTLNPIVNSENGRTQTPSADEVGLSKNGEEIAVTSFEAVKEGDGLPVDIVFLIDTTGSMAWAIDGVKQGVTAFLDVVNQSGMDARVGGWEFGDFPRSSIAPGPVGPFQNWLDELAANGGGDLPENDLDTIAAAYETFPFRKGAMRYFVVVTDVGFHEAGEGAECTTHTLADIVSLTGGSVLYGVVMSNLGLGDSGVPVEWITDVAGGLYVEYDATDVLLSFDISADTPLDELLDSTYTLTAGGDTVGVGDVVDVAWTRDGETWTAALPVQ